MNNFGNMNINDSKLFFVSLVVMDFLDVVGLLVSVNFGASFAKIVRPF